MILSKKNAYKQIKLMRFKNRFNNWKNLKKNSQDKNKLPCVNMIKIKDNLMIILINLML